MFQISYFTFIAVVFLFFEFGVKGDGSHSYQPQDKVPFYVNKIGPYANPSETYEYYILPFCVPEKIQVSLSYLLLLLFFSRTWKFCLQHKHHTIGEDFKGDHKVTSLYDIRFQGLFYLFIFIYFHLPPFFLSSYLTKWTKKKKLYCIRW